MKRHLLILAATLSLAGCAGGYTSAEFVYAEPVEYEYAVPVDHVVVVTREVLVTRGWTVYRVQRSGPNRIIWARRGDDRIVRIFATPRGERVAVRGLQEERERGDHGRHKGWAKRGEPREIISDIDVRLRARG
ncbi:MAG: hypothetical protein DMD48_06215 [Gemmatimonadetes bacterium]|nr:MAG: hypothetical protein DMD48_06215 [Gemmatimonadota bacterium]HYT64126.1 hypothetical protein [Gemmatimonadales bacterium]